MADTAFLLCCNCDKWGQPWRIGRRTIICSERGHTPESKACRYFVPIDSLPPTLQKIRLFVQTLDALHRDYLRWALEQAELVLQLHDAEGSPLAMGDRVSFRLGKYGHAGTIEGTDPQCAQAVIVSSAFFDSSISVIASSVTRTSEKDAREIVGNNAIKTPWEIPALIEEITTIRAIRRKSKENSLALIHYESQLLTFERRLRHDTLRSEMMK